VNVGRSIQEEGSTKTTRGSAMAEDGFVEIDSSVLWIWYEWKIGYVPKEGSHHVVKCKVRRSIRGDRHSGNRRRRPSRPAALEHSPMRLHGIEFYWIRLALHSSRKSPSRFVDSNGNTIGKHIGTFQHRRIEFFYQNGIV